MASAQDDGHGAQAVRFKTQNEEIEPPSAVQTNESTASSNDAPREAISPDTEKELRDLSKELQTSQTSQSTRLQAKRMENFAFEPVSLPTSRVPSNSSSAQPTPAQSGRSTPLIQSPPLTPAGSESREGKAGSVNAPGNFNNGRQDQPMVLTPQDSPPRDSEPHGERRISAAARARLSANSSVRPKSMIEMSGAVPSHPKLPPSFNVGPAGDSQPVSADSSPVHTPGATTPGASTPSAGQPFSRPFTPVGDANDPYSRSRRVPQSKNLDAIDPRFIFGARDNRRGRSHTSSTSVPRPRAGGSEGRDEKQRHSFFGGSTRKPETDESSSAPSTKQHHHGSMSELKRFFKLGGSKKEKEKAKSKPVSRTQSPSGSIKHHRSNHRSGTRTPPSNSSGSVNVPFADDHGLESKYGKFGKVLGSGAGGSVRLLKRTTDGVTFAVKQFRARHAYESERDYNKKVTAEFCIGSTLHHGNIIETMDIIQEKGSWFEVMEYAPFDLFATVMTGKMSREEVSCCTLQILNGVTYLHSMGLAHRDLKLDNVVINEHGIMKIIDFGSAVVFRYPFENDIVLASGIVGSDPYLAPEVYDLPKYDPQPADIWSIAIIYCCMTLRRFPWKAPRLSDNSYKLFVAEANDGPRPRTSIEAASAPASREGTEKHHHHHHHNNNSSAHSDPTSKTGEDSSTKSTTTASNGQSQQQQQPPQSIKGPWRLLRLLPRETRTIVGRMLEVDPKRRATLDEILADPWVGQSAVCRQEEGGLVVRAQGHEHHLEPGAGGGVDPSKAG